MQLCLLGRRGPPESTIGLGCMQMSRGLPYPLRNPYEDDEKVETIEAALDEGIKRCGPRKFEPSLSPVSPNRVSA